MEIVKVEISEKEMLIIEKGGLSELTTLSFDAMCYGFADLRKFRHYWALALFPTIAGVLCALSGIITLVRYGETEVSIFNIVLGTFFSYTLITGNWSVFAALPLRLRRLGERVTKRRIGTGELWGAVYLFTKSGYSMIFLDKEPNIDQCSYDDLKRSRVGLEYFVDKKDVLWIQKNALADGMLISQRKNLPGPRPFPAFHLDRKSENIHVIEPALFRYGFEKR